MKFKTYINEALPKVTLEKIISDRYKIIKRMKTMTSSIVKEDQKSFKYALELAKPQNNLTRIQESEFMDESKDLVRLVGDLAINLNQLLELPRNTSDNEKLIKTDYENLAEALSIILFCSSTKKMNEDRAADRDKEIKKALGRLKDLETKNNLSQSQLNKLEGQLPSFLGSVLTSAAMGVGGAVIGTAFGGPAAGALMGTVGAIDGGHDHHYGKGVFGYNADPATIEVMISTKKAEQRIIQKMIDIQKNIIENGIDEFGNVKSGSDTYDLISRELKDTGGRLADMGLAMFPIIFGFMGVANWSSTQWGIISLITTFVGIAGFIGAAGGGGNADPRTAELEIKSILRNIEKRKAQILLAQKKVDLKKKRIVTIENEKRLWSSEYTREIKEYKISISSVEHLLTKLDRLISDLAEAKKKWTKVGAYNPLKENVKDYKKYQVKLLKEILKMYKKSKNRKG